MFNRCSSRKGSVTVGPLAAVTTVVCFLLLSAALAHFGVTFTSGGTVVATVVIVVLCISGMGKKLLPRCQVAGKQRPRQSPLASLSCALRGAAPAAASRGA